MRRRLAPAHRGGGDHSAAAEQGGEGLQRVAEECGWSGDAKSCECKPEPKATPAKDMDQLVRTITDKVMAALNAAV